MSKLLKAFRHSDEGATMVEYGLMVALIAAVCVASVSALGVSVSGLFNTIAGSF
jgi:pilus assembly protein Flp/PilA